jgi:phospholipase A1
MNKKISTLLLMLIISLSSIGQIITKDSINSILKKAPSFTIYQDNYFLTGVPTNETVTKKTADAKFQISFKERLTNAELPFNTYMFLTYTQKSFWNIYEKSSPFSETNYNPAIGIGKFFVSKDQYLHVVALTIEHESNGKDSTSSRSWNRISMHYMIPLSKKASLFVKGWLPFSYKTDNPDLIKYVGYGEINYIQKSDNERFIFDVTFKKGATWDNKVAVNAQVAFRLSKSTNQYLSIQYYYGYAESLINYQEKTQMIRLGLVIKPSKFVFY